MAQFFVSLVGGAYTLVEDESLDHLEARIEGGRVAGGFLAFTRPDGKSVRLAPNDVTLIQPPAPPAFRDQIKEN